jgi:hypothetical protein
VSGARSAGSRSEWGEGVAELRGKFRGLDFDVAAQLVGGVLRREPAAVARVADETGVPYSTVGKHAREVRG